MTPTSAGRPGPLPDILGRGSPPPGPAEDARPGDWVSRDSECLRGQEERSVTCPVVTGAAGAALPVRGGRVPSHGAQGSFLPAGS